jgi:hypothetical protein
MNTIQLIKRCAEIPSWSTREKRLAPFIESVVVKVKNAKLEYIPDSNIVVSVPGKPGLPPVAITSHLDKINHFEGSEPERLPFAIKKGMLTGQLDDSVGVGICLSVLARSARGGFPPLLFLFSEMEECGCYEDDDDSELFHGIGGCRISQYLMDTRQIPRMFVTIDTSPQFSGNKGVALYTRFWEKCSLMPGDKLVTESETIGNYLYKKFPFLTLTNGSNDYINYGMLFNADHDIPIPSIAIEPAIHPCHKPGEQVHISDIKKTFRIVSHLLSAYADNRIDKIRV